jgi:hypothetical protein
MTASMTEDRSPATRHLRLPPATRNGQMTEILYLHLHLDTRTRDLMAETWDLKVFLPQPIIRSPVSL